jgi:hypothetical protein
MAKFITGQQLNPFTAGSQESINLLESMTAMQLASCVPIIKLTKIDKNGHPSLIDESGRPQRPLMFDLIQSPQFGSTQGDTFGIDQESYKERGMISLRSLNVSSELSYGMMMFRKVTINFTVHRPDLVFDPSSQIPWHDILVAGMSFSLEYGWNADPVLVDNPLFNGFGHREESGVVVKSTSTMLIAVTHYELAAKQNGEVDVTVHAYENSDIALRRSKVSDAFDDSKPLSIFQQLSLNGQGEDIQTVAKLKNMLNGLKKVTSFGKEPKYRMEDVLNTLIAPLIESAVKLFGYSGVDLLLANFSKRSCSQSENYGNQSMAGKSIGEFLIPVKEINKALTIEHLAKGRIMFLHSFINIIISTMLSKEAWGTAKDNHVTPNVMMKSNTVLEKDGRNRLILTILDNSAMNDSFSDKSSRIPLDEQTKETILKTVIENNVPIIEFSRAGTLILEAAFHLQPDAQLQSVQIDQTYAAEKDRVELAHKTDKESRENVSDGKEILPISIMEADITMVGNFALESFARIWIEFFSSRSISGVYYVFEKTDVIEPGKFTSQFKIRSDGSDPLNTRQRMTNKQFAAQAAATAKLKADYNAKQAKLKKK